MMIQYFLMLIVLLLVSGLAIDTGLLQWRQLSLQNAADAAAVEGMYQHARGDAAWATEAKAQSASNGYTDGVSGVTVTMTSPPTSGTYAADPMAVQATVVQQNISNVFMTLVNGFKSTVAASATAREIPTCIWIMNAAGSASASLWLASAGMYANCGVYVNTQASGSNLGVDGFATLNSTRIRAVGPSSKNLSSGSVSQHPKFGAAVKMDPLAYVKAPIVGSCTFSNISISSVTATGYPGVYCGTMNVSNSTLTLTPGLYIMTGGMTLTNSSLTGTGVTFYFTKDSTATNYSNVAVSNSTLTLKAPTSSANGGIPGVLFFADRNWAAHGTQGFQFTYSPFTFDGYWYALNTGVYLWSSAINFSSYNGLVVDNLYQYGAASRWDNSNFTALGGVSPLHYEDGVLVQ